MLLKLRINFIKVLNHGNALSRIAELTGNIEEEENKKEMLGVIQMFE